jgi:hypothetical protein
MQRLGRSGFLVIKHTSCQQRLHPRHLASIPFAASVASSAGGLVDRLLRDQGKPSTDSAWVDGPTTIVEDPLHPNGFDFAVDLNRPPSSTGGVAGFAADLKRGSHVRDVKFAETVNTIQF